MTLFLRWSISCVPDSWSQRWSQRFIHVGDVDDVVVAVDVSVGDSGAGGCGSEYGAFAVEDTTSIMAFATGIAAGLWLADEVVGTERCR